MEQITGHYTIKQIFQDWWDVYLKAHPNLPQHVLENVNKMLACRNPAKLGYVKRTCPDHPDKSVIIPHSCKSRFCNSCGKVAVDKWLTSACSTFPNVPYVHITWTVPAELRPLLKDKPDCRKLLFQVSSQIILEWCQARGFIPAITSVIHTFGRDLKFHPHIHMLVSAGGLDVKTRSRWLVNQYLPEGMLKEKWRAKLLYRLYGQRLISRRLKQLLFRMKWFLHLTPDLLLPLVTTNYIGRYTKRPPLAEARIEQYDGLSVSFAFDDWYLNKLRSQRTVTVLEFIELLVQHIPKKHARLINHYGLLHNRIRSKYLAVVKERFGQIPTLRPVHDWRTRQKEYHGVDPLLCPVCQKEMVITAVAYWSKKTHQLKVILF